MNPEDAVTDYLVNYLSADTTLMAMLEAPIQAQVFSERAASPFVRVEYLDGADLLAVGTFRVWADMTYHIRASEHWRSTGVPDRSNVNAIGARLDALLHGHAEQTATSDGSGTISMHAFREDPEPIPASLETDGTLWLQSGGIYRVRSAVF